MSLGCWTKCRRLKGNPLCTDNQESTWSQQDGNIIKITDVQSGIELVKWDTVLLSHECLCFSPDTEALNIFSVLKPDMNKFLVKTTHWQTRVSKHWAVWHHQQTAMNPIKADKSEGLQEFGQSKNQFSVLPCKQIVYYSYMSPVILHSHFKFLSGVLLHLFVRSCLKASNRDVLQGQSMPAIAIPDMKKGIELLFLY